jgi:hypothetical protein
LIPEILRTEILPMKEYFYYLFSLIFLSYVHGIDNIYILPTKNLVRLFL